MDATYSPEDNKLRLYAESRLDRETYDRVKAAGFRWAPKQELFVAPMWTPDREDLLLELAGEIGDEDKSLVERAEERSDRFRDYSHNRADDADSARKAVSAIADHIPLGQPILVGHHSEKRARRDAAKIENGMRRAVKMWEQSEYWKDRAKGAIRHAKYKELPSVRARRIKGIEADKRKQERTKAHAELVCKFWRGELKKKDGSFFDPLNRGAALGFCNRFDHWSGCFPLDKYPRTNPDASTYEGQMCLWSALGGSKPEAEAIITPQQARDLSLPSHERTIERCNRWIAHYENRLAYERAMLEDAGGIATDRKGPEKGGGCKCWASHRGGFSYIQKVNQVSVTVLDNWSNGGANFTRTIPFDKLGEIVTAAEVEAARAEGRLIDFPDKTGFTLCGTAPAQTTAPTIEEKSQAETTPCPRCGSNILPGRMEHHLTWCPTQTTAPTIQDNVQAADFKAMKETLAAGVQVVSANQLFPTPVDLCERMADLADLTAGDKVLEPSAGTGNLLKAIKARGIFNGDLQGIEINTDLANRLKVQQFNVRCADFLDCVDENGFDRILMNPPFENGADIKHIKHALGFLRPGGRLVAICANGPRQQEKLYPLCKLWEPLPAGTFNGTNVNAALLVIDAPPAKIEAEICGKGVTIDNDAGTITQQTLNGQDLTKNEAPAWPTDCRRVQRFHDGLPQTTNGQGELF